MLIGKIDKAFEPSSHCPAKDLGKHRQQDQEEQRTLLSKYQKGISTKRATGLWQLWLQARRENIGK